MKAKQKALVEQIEKEKIQSNKGSSYKLLVEQAKLKQATSKVRIQTFDNSFCQMSLRGGHWTTLGVATYIKVHISSDKYNLQTDRSEPCGSVSLAAL